MRLQLTIGMKKHPKYIDLFAGCGGLSTGLYMSGWQGLFAVERSPDAFLTLKENLIDNRSHFKWPDWLDIQAWCIKQLLVEKSKELCSLRGSVDLVVGGPPCQGFSTAGRRVESDHRNSLVHSYLDFVEAVQPKAILFENVRGFTMKFHGSDNSVAYSSFVIEALRDLGYKDAVGHIIDASKYGVPQKRRRYIAIATLNGKADKIFAKLQSSSVPFLKSRRIPIQCTASTALSDLEKRHGMVPSPDTNGFSAGLKGNATTGLQKYLRRDQRQAIPDSHRFVNHTDEVIHVFKRMLKKAPRNCTISGDARAPYGLKKRGATVLAFDQPTPTITTIPDDFIHYSEPRVMTPRECARLQTFPDWFCFQGPYTTGGQRRKSQTPRYSQIGNAVPPLLAEQLGAALKKVLHG